MRPPYAEYVKFAMRSYLAREMNGCPESEIGVVALEKNWLACNSAFQSFNEDERLILKEVYGSYDTMPDNVYQAAKRRNVPQNDVWQTINRFESEFARLRGLI